MGKWGAIALFGMLAGAVALAPSASAEETPAFVNATMCDVAAPISSGATIFSRQVRAERRVAAPAQRRAPAARPAPRKPVEPAAQADAPAPEAEAVLYPAVHFCVSPAGASRPVRYT
jgi:hypothetical protein